VQSVYNAFAAGDVPTVLAAFAADMEWKEAEGFIYADGNPYIGGNAILASVFARLATEWDNFAAKPFRFHDAGSVIIAEGRYTGTYKNTGAPIDAQFAHLWTVANGKITHFQQYTDTLQAARVTATI
jgi:ketosteroid isomerase-like protein